MASLLPEPLVTYGTSGSVVKDAWFVTASHPPFVKLSILVRADSHGSSVGPVNHVLRAIRGHYPASITDRGFFSRCPQDHPATGSRAAQRTEWSCSLEDVTPPVSTYHLPAVPLVPAESFFPDDDYRGIRNLRCAATNAPASWETGPPRPCSPLL